jgi:hypothetical protein
VSIALDPLGTVLEANDQNNTASQVFPVSSAISCSMESTIRSTAGDSPTTIQFTNRTTQTVRVFWLDYEGKRVLYNTLEAGATYVQGTFLTHPWILVGADETCYGIWLPTTGASSVGVP